MRLSVWMAFMHVMGRLGVWKPYLLFIEEVLRVLDRACEEEFGPMWDEGLYDIETGTVIDDSAFRKGEVIG